MYRTIDIIFKGLIRVRSNFGPIETELSKFTHNMSDYKQVSYEYLASKSDSMKQILSYQKQEADFQANLISDAIKKIPNLEKQKQLTIDICDNSFFNNNLAKWNITELVKMYEKNPVDVFIALVSTAKPFGIGALSHKKQNNKKHIQDFVYEIVKSGGKQREVFFDYYNGIGVKNGFPIDINDPKSPFELNMRSYNERNCWYGYDRIVEMLGK